MAPRDEVKRYRVKHGFAPLSGFTREGKSRVLGEIRMIEFRTTPKGEVDIKIHPVDEFPTERPDSGCPGRCLTMALKYRQGCQL